MGRFAARIGQWRLGRVARPAVAGRLPVEELRALIAGPFARFGTMPRKAKVTDAAFGDLRGEWITIQGAAAPRVILFFHGGFYVAGSAAQYRPFAARLAQASDAQVLSLDYRLAPEHPFPAPINDALAAYRWLLGHRLPPETIAFAGDGSGGGLAMAALLAIRKAQLPMPAGVALISPWTDLSLASWSVVENASNDRLLSWGLLMQCARHYLSGHLPTHSMGSPVYGDLTGLPPVIVQAGDSELLRDDATRLAARLTQAGVRVNVEIHAGMPHAFHTFGFLSEAKAATDRAGAFIRSVTGQRLIGQG